MTPLDFDEVWLVDFEYSQPLGEPVQQVHCMVARELRSNRLLRLFADELDRLDQAPFRTDERALYVAYYASAEMHCHLALGWPKPAYVLDLFVEFRNHTNGRAVPAGNKLLGALAYFGLDALSVAEKTAMRELAIRGGPFTGDEKQALLDYCQSDVDALVDLLEAMSKHRAIHLPQALLRGRYMSALAQVEANGVPLDGEALAELRAGWDEAKLDLAQKLDRGIGVYEGANFVTARFEHWLASNGIGWPRHPSGQLKLDQDTFKDMAPRHPGIEHLRQLRYSLGQLRLEKLQAGSDNRNRCMLSPFGSKTGRNQPSNTKFIFGPAVWLRGLIKPPPGHGLAYVDWSQQELGIAAALSGDEQLADSYHASDPYLAFAQMAGVVPEGATKQSHPTEREQFKACTLATQYGMGARSLGVRIGCSTYEAQRLLDLHRKTFPVFWDWSDRAVLHASLYSKTETVFGWQLGVEDVKPSALRNFPMQANGAEMLRLAVSYAVEGGIQVVAPVHDALLIEAPLADLADHVAQTQAAMQRAGAEVLGGFQLGSDAKVVHYPDRYADERGVAMWDEVWGLINPARQRAEVGQNSVQAVGT
jgi:hypothetical protein